jgi:hypothetical protein
MHITIFPLHFANVATRWAHEQSKRAEANELGALEVLQKIFSATRWKLAYIRVKEGLIQKAKPVFQKSASELKYGLHFANVATRECRRQADVRRYNYVQHDTNVLSRWARE